MPFGEKKNTLSKYLSPLGAFALSLGCAVGWGSVVMPGTTFLPVAGPIGTLIGIITGAFIMLLIGVCYHFLMNRFPDAGGTMSYTIRAFGYDHGFLAAWFLLLVYLAIFWANATAFVLIFRNIFGGVLQFGFHYVVAGYDVYLGEILITLALILFAGLACISSKKSAITIQIIMVLMLFIGAIICGILVLSSGTKLIPNTPAFAPTGRSKFSQILNIVVLAPWAFVGFESISNSAQEFRFSTKKTLPIMSASLTAGTICYVLFALIAASAVPEGCSSWVEYIDNLGNQSGTASIPTLFGMENAAGKLGLYILALAVSGGIISGLVGNMIGASRLLYSMSENNYCPKWLGELDEKGNPKKAFLGMVIISLFIPFVGRAAIGWIVDISTIGALIAYAFTCAAAAKIAQEEKNRFVFGSGIFAFIVSFIMGIYFMVPSIWTISALATESYMMLIGWSILGFILFRIAFSRDKKDRFGKKASVWMVLLFLILFTTMLWLRAKTNIVTVHLSNTLVKTTEDLYNANGWDLSDAEDAALIESINKTLSYTSSQLIRDSWIQMIIIIISLLIMLNVYRVSEKRELDLRLKQAEAEQSNIAKTRFLSSMSHDIRTPMNAIIGYTNLAQKEKDVSPVVAEYLDKIELSGNHLLDLINDILEISRVESGKLELHPEPVDITGCISQVSDMFSTQMKEKGVNFNVDTSRIQNTKVICDSVMFVRVVMNLVSNAYKFTPPGGNVSVELKQVDSITDNASFELRVKDTGRGMSPEFAATVFDAYSRDRTVTEIQGTGLGMAITKHIVDLMDGEITVESELGKGTEFKVRVEFPVISDIEEKEEEESVSMDFSGVHLLLADDNEINRDIAALILEEAGFTLTMVTNGKEVVDMLKAAGPGVYRAILMDIQMPKMNGYEATRVIRALPDKELSTIPIVAMTANAFAEDVRAAKDAGMDGHIAKPIDVPVLLKTLAELLR